MSVHVTLCVSRMFHIKIKAGDANSLRGIPMTTEVIDGLNVNTPKSQKTMILTTVTAFSEKKSIFLSLITFQAT